MSDKDLQSGPEALPEPYTAAAPPSSNLGNTPVSAGHDVHVAGDVVGRDKITTIGYSPEAVSTLLAQISATFQPRPFDGRCPYRGLQAFEAEDAEFFFGREALVAQLVARVEQSRYVVVAGPSGSGKSSLVRAGLIHALQHNRLPDSDRWGYATLVPGRNPLASLARAVSGLARTPSAGKDIYNEGKTDATMLHEWVEIALGEGRDRRAVIFVDQFEETFTQATHEDERVAFLNLFTHAATVEGGRAIVLFALRSDFVADCATYPQLNALLNQQFLQVGAMQADELVRAIAQPALSVGLRIDPDLIAQIVNDMRGEPGALPLMQFALRDLFEARQAQGGVIALTL
ncbi:MAG: ATP-binding protein, partial [Anaerolineales bacterium]